MTFIEIVHALKLGEAQLAASVRTSASTRKHARLLGRVANLMDAAEGHEPHDIDELREMVAFFIRRSSRNYNDTSACRDLDHALALSNRMAEEIRPARGGTRPVPRKPSQLAAGVADPDELSSFMSATPDRMVAVGTTERYLAVSPGNARFNNSTPARMVDLHIAEIIGSSRYENRAAPALRKCFGGERQVYVYPIVASGDTARLIRCEMMPIRDRSNQLYCSLMRMDDITESAAQAPDRTGTTPRHGGSDRPRPAA